MKNHELLKGILKSIENTTKLSENGLELKMLQKRGIAQSFSVLQKFSQ